MNDSPPPTPYAPPVVEPWLAHVLDTMAEAVITVDAIGRIVLFNRSAAALFGVAAQEVLGGPLDRLLPPVLREAHRRHVEALLQEPSDARRTARFRPVRGLHADGHEITLDATIARTGDAEQVLLTVMIRDPAAARPAAQAWLARLDHEVRTPLNAILGFTELMRQECASADAGRRHLEPVLEAATRLRDFVDGVLGGPGPEAPVPDERLAGASPAPSGCVLYIEDEPVNRLLVREVLSAWPGVRVQTADDGASGIACAGATCPDLVLLDMQLPDMSGLDVLAALRADPRTRALRVVGLSARSMPRDVREALAAGCLDYWTKPVDISSFRAGVQRLLRDAAALAPLAATQTPDAH